MISPEQFRAARAILDCSYDEMEARTGLAKLTLQNIARGASRPQEATLQRLHEFLEKSGIELIHGGARLRQDIVTIFEHAEGYLRILDDILREKPEEVLFLAADERKSTEGSIKGLAAIRNSGIKMRSLLRNGDTYFMGSPEEYRWMPDGLYVNSDVQAIYDDCVVYSINWQKNAPRVIRIKDRDIAESHRRLFLHLWNNAEGPKESTSKIFYD